MIKPTILKLSQLKEYFEIKIGLTEKILTNFQNSKAKKFIFFSCVKVVTDKVEGDILIEDILLSPIDPYAKSKLAAEKFILANFQELAVNNQHLRVNRKPKTGN